MKIGYKPKYFTATLIWRHWGNLPMEHSSMSWLQAPPTKPAGQVQIARPLRGLVSHTAPSLQGLLTHASSRWHSKPMKRNHIKSINSTLWRCCSEDGTKWCLPDVLTCLSNGALAEEGRHTVMAGGPIKAYGCCTVINVFTAIISSPPINTYTSMSANGVEASAPIVASIGLHETLIDILCTVLSCSG